MKIKEKIDNFLSGSDVKEEISDLAEVKTYEDAASEEKEENIKHLVEDTISTSDLFEDLLSEMWVEKELQEYGAPDVYQLKKPENGDYYWLIEYRTKMLSPVRHSSEVVPVLDLGDNKFVCWIGKTQYIVEASIMSYVGEN